MTPSERVRGLFAAARVRLRDGEMACPKCRAEVPITATECPKCGVLFGKLRLSRPLPPPKEKTSRLGGWLALPGIGALAVCGWSLYAQPQQRTERAEAEGPQPDQAALVAVPLEVPAASDLEALAQEGSQDDAEEVEEAGETARTRGAGPKLEPAPARPLPDLERSTAWEEGTSAYESALSRLGVTSPPLLVYVGADWCPYCGQLEEVVLPDRDVDRALRLATKVKLNEKTASDKALAKELGVTGYPTLLLFTRKDQPAMHINSGVARGAAANPSALAQDFTKRVAYDWHQQVYQALSSDRLDEAIEGADRLLAFRDGEDPGGLVLHLRGLAFYKKGPHAEALRDFVDACQRGHAADCATLRR